MVLRTAGSLWTVQILSVPDGGSRGRVKTKGKRGPGFAISN